MVGGKAEDIIFTSGGTEVIITVTALSVCSALKSCISFVWECFVQNHGFIHVPVVHFQANNLVLHTAVEHFRRSCRAAEQSDGQLPHIITSNVEHDSVKLVAEHLQRDGKAGGTSKRIRYFFI